MKIAQENILEKKNLFQLFCVSAYQQGESDYNPYIKIIDPVGLHLQG